MEDWKRDAFESFAAAYPHEANEMDPEGFWEMFHRHRPAISREEMNKLLEETRQPPVAAGSTGAA